MEENKWHFQHIMLYYFKKGTNTTETQIFVQCVEKVLWLIECVKSGLWSFVLEISHWQCSTVVEGEVDSNQIETLIETNQNSTTWEIVNILKILKSIKLLVKMKNVSFLWWEKLNRLFGQPNTSSASMKGGPWNLYFTTGSWSMKHSLISKALCHTNTIYL